VGRSGRSLHQLLLEDGVPDRGARIYLAACREGPLTAAELARRAQLNRVDAYRFIRQLSAIGLLRATSGRPMRFAPLPPEQFLDRVHHKAAEKVEELEGERERILLGWREALDSPDGADHRRFTVLEGAEEAVRFLKRKVGATEKEILACGTRESLTRTLDYGLDRGWKEARARGVKVRLLVHIQADTLALVKQFEPYAEIRHSPSPIGVPSLQLDRTGLYVNISDQYTNGSAAEPLIGLWTTSPELLRQGREYFRHLWARSTESATRQVALEAPSSATLSIVAGREDEGLLRLKEVAELGMRAAGVQELQLDLVGLIDTIGRQLGREIGDRLSGETPPEVVQAIRDYYTAHGMGEVTVVKDRPLTLRVNECFAAQSPSAEVGRVLCPAILGAALERRLGAQWSVSTGDLGRGRRSGCLFTIVPP
jgi:sugar-specific transcriptional regulator TrmB